ncbi:MAG: DUF1858 domain-containing protein [candidate division Zixibacteria bacterium]
MTKKNIEITPYITVSKLLETYPELEDVLIGIAPPFKKLKNPILRRSVAKVATIKHISSVGNVPLNELINTLRRAVGQPEIKESYDEENYFQPEPDWFSVEKISVSINEDKLGSTDKMTLAVILKKAKTIKKDEIIELVTTFLPAPGIDIMKSKGYFVWSIKVDNGIIKSYFLKNS